MTYRSNSLHARDIASIVHPQTNLSKHVETGPTIFDRAEGVYVYDTEGNRYLEGASALWSAALGFNVERLATVAYNQMRNLGYYHIYRSSSHGPAIELAERLLDIAPVPMSKVLFQCSGSEANDTAIKLSWYYWHAVGKPQKRKIISRIQSYHGSTCASVSLTGKQDMHADFGLPFDGFLHTDFPHYFRFRTENETEEQFSERMASNLEALILKEGPETIAAFFAEPVMGAGGAVVPPKGYFEKVQAVLKRHDILFVADEVICGFGRTGHMWGTQTYGLVPDMITSAKALSASMAPISALMINERVYDAMLVESEKLGNFAHGYTYAGHPVMAAVALETLNIYRDEDILGHVASVAPTFLELMDSLTDHPLIGEFRGVGLIGGFEIVGERGGRSAPDARLQLPQRIDTELRKHGLILRIIGNRIALSPPLIITNAQVEELHGKLLSSLNAVQRDLL